MAKENKFTRSVLERLEQEQQKQKEDQKLQPSIVAAEAVERKGRAKAKKSVSEEKISISTSSPEEKSEEEIKIPDLSQFISKKEERVAQNKTFYLDQEVIDALHMAAKMQSMTDSRLANEILRGVLGIP